MVGRGALALARSPESLLELELGVLHDAREASDVGLGVLDDLAVPAAVRVGVALALGLKEGAHAGHDGHGWHLGCGWVLCFAWCKRACCPCLAASLASLRKFLTGPFLGGSVRGPPARAPCRRLETDLSLYLTRFGFVFLKGGRRKRETREMK